MPRFLKILLHRAAPPWRSLVYAFALGAWVIVGFAAVARADDWDDCTSNVADRILAGCSGVISQGTRAPADLVKAYVNRAGVYARHGNGDQSLRDAESALALDPQAVGALLQRGLLHRQKGRLDAALADFERAIEIDPNNGYAFALRGNLRATRREWAQALADVEQAIALRPDNVNAYNTRG
jgi:tetratricopeptide (TPR) repeat protein